LNERVEAHVIGEQVRRFRLRRHVSVRSFAAQTGFSPSFISQLENGLVSPSLGSLQKIADALEVTLGEFLASAAAEEEPLIVREAERRTLDSTWTDAHLQALGSMARSRRLEPVLAIFGGGGKSGKHVHSHSREQFAYVIAGTVRLTLADEDFELCAGDSVTIPAQAPHRWENVTSEPVEILIVAAKRKG
jgi:transcriptional regulator with XRE-family HTH domain